MPTSVVEARAEAMAEAQAVHALRHYAEQRSIETDAKRSKEGAGVVLRRWLDKNQLPLKDGETGWCAFYETTERVGDFDYAHMDDTTLLLLARAGAFRAESRAALAQIGRKDPEVGELIRKWQMPGGEARSLEVRNIP